MIAAKGDLWDVPADVRVLTTNGFVKADGRAVMGRGVAAQARDRYPEIEADLGRLLKVAGNHAFLLPTHTRGWGFLLATFPVKHRWMEDADVRLIEQSARELVGLANVYGWQRVVLPRPGCGNGRLRWEDVRPRIEDILDKRFTVVYDGS